MFGRKARQIANQAIMIATARIETRELRESVLGKNKQIIALNDTIQEHTQQIEDLRAKLTRAEGSADAAIQAGGVISSQLHAAQDELALKTATIAKLNLDLEDLKGAKGRLAEALRQEREHLTVVRRERAWLLGNLSTAQKEEFRLLAQTAERAREDSAHSRPALEKLREEIAKVREGDVEVVWELPAQAERIDTAMERYEAGVMPMPAQADADEQPNPTS